MTNDELRTLISRLDSEIPRDGASARWFHDSYFDAIVVEATKRGYLRLGTEFLKAAFAERRRCDIISDRSELDVDIRYVLSGEQSVWPLHFNRDESLRAPEPVHQRESVVTRAFRWSEAPSVVLVCAFALLIVFLVAYFVPQALMEALDWIAALF